MADRPTRVEKGISLARGPALILGTILLAVGLFLLYKARTFPPFHNFPNGTAHTDGTFLFGIFGANGWTAMLTAVAGGLLLFGAAQHLLAKTMSLIVGVVLAAAALIAVFDHGNVLGLAAANGWTELGWGIVAVILLFNSLIPRRRRVVPVEDGAAAGGGAMAADRRGYVEPAGTRSGMATRDMENRRGMEDRDAAVDGGAGAAGGGAATTTAGAGATSSTRPGAVRGGTDMGSPQQSAAGQSGEQPLVTREDGAPVDTSTDPGATESTRPMRP